MQNFTVQELYEISDALMERRARWINRRAALAAEGMTSETADRMIECARTAHLKIEEEIIKRSSTL